MAVTVFPSPQSASGGPLKFVISVGSSGNNGYILAEPVSAGVYSVVSALSDSSYDIYFLGKNGQQVGYTSSSSITATSAIYSISIIGANTGDTLTFERSQTIVPTTLGEAAGAGAYITSVSVSALQDINDSTVVTGGNFASDVEVYFVGTDATAIEAKTVVRNSATELVATRPDVFLVSASPYDVQVINPGATPPTKTNAHILPDAVTAGANPVWVTPAGQLSDSYTVDVPYTFQLSATDSDGGSGGLIFAITSGSLIAGLSMSSSGLISGTITSSGLSATFTVTVSDDGGNTASREFSIAETASISGGLEITSSGYKYHIFKTSGTLTHIGGSKNVEILVVSGGGGGAGGNGGGGGGGSNAVVSYLSVAGSHTVSVGAGGSQNSAGTASSINISGYSVAGVGGSGGSGATGGTGGTPSGGKGGNYAGGNGVNGGSTYYTWAQVSSTGQISSSLGYYGGGGGAGNDYNPAGNGGLGGGGRGAAYSGAGYGSTAGTVNTGGAGGGGSTAIGSGGAGGGSGVLIVRHAV